jgi:hypothetical protein
MHYPWSFHLYSTVPFACHSDMGTVIGTSGHCTLLRLSSFCCYEFMACYQPSLVHIHSLWRSFACLGRNLSRAPNNGYCLCNLKKPYLIFPSHKLSRKVCSIICILRLLVSKLYCYPSSLVVVVLIMNTKSRSFASIN